MSTQKTFLISFFLSFIGSLCFGAQEQSQSNDWDWVQFGEDIHRVATKELAKIKTQNIAARDEADRLYDKIFKRLWDRFNDVAAELTTAQMDYEPTAHLEQQLEILIPHLVDAKKRLLAALKSLGQAGQRNIPPRFPRTGWQGQVGTLAEGLHPHLGQHSAARNLPPQALRDIADYLQTRNVCIRYDGEPNVTIKITNLKTNTVIWQGWFQGAAPNIWADVDEPSFIKGYPGAIIEIPLDPIHIEVSMRLHGGALWSMATNDLTAKNVGRLNQIKAELGSSYLGIKFFDDLGNEIR